MAVAGIARNHRGNKSSVYVKQKMVLGAGMPKYTGGGSFTSLQ